MNIYICDKKPAAPPYIGVLMDALSPCYKFILLCYLLERYFCRLRYLPIRVVAQPYSIAYFLTYCCHSFTSYRSAYHESISF